MFSLYTDVACVSLLLAKYQMFKDQTHTHTHKNPFLIVFPLIYFILSFILQYGWKVVEVVVAKRNDKSYVRHYDEYMLYRIS